MFTNNTHATEDRTIYTNVTEDRTLYTHATDSEDRTMYTAETSAFMSEDSEGWFDFDHRSCPRGRRVRHSRGSSRRRADSSLMEDGEDDDNDGDGRFFTITDACISYMCDGCDGTDAISAGANGISGDEDDRMREDEIDWNGKRERKHRNKQKRQKEFMEEDATEGEDSHDSSQRTRDSNPITVKERLASLKREQSKKSSASSTTDATSPTLIEKLRGVSGIPPHIAVGEHQEEDAADETSFWKGDGVWNSDPSVLGSVLVPDQLAAAVVPPWPG